MDAESRPKDTSAWHSCYFTSHILSNRKYRISFVDLTCTMSVIDVEGCKRFSQSFVFEYDGTQDISDPEIFVHDYVSRNSLLASADELLPDDTLTIQLDIALKKHLTGSGYVDFSVEDMLASSFKLNPPCHQQPVSDAKDDLMLGDSCGFLTPPYYLWLNSPIADMLRRESEYFQRLCVTSMTEKNSGCVKILDKNYKSFVGIVKILCMLERYNHHLRFTFDEILNIYELADFCGIERVLDTCRCWLRLVSRTVKDISLISEFAYVYHYDHSLCEIANEMIAKILNDELDLRSMPLDGGDEIWNYMTFPPSPGMGTPSSNIFHFELRWENVLKKEILVKESEVGDLSHCYI